MTSMPHLDIRPILQEPYSIMIRKLDEQDTHTNTYIHKKLLFQAFCGLGKSRVMYNLISDTIRDLIVYVFPYINLLKQFNNDYIQNFNANNEFSIISICSDIEQQYSGI